MKDSCGIPQNYDSRTTLARRPVITVESITGTTATATIIGSRSSSATIGATAPTPITAGNATGCGPTASVSYRGTADCICGTVTTLTTAVRTPNLRFSTTTTGTATLTGKTLTAYPGTASCTTATGTTRTTGNTTPTKATAFSDNEGTDRRVTSFVSAIRATNSSPTVANGNGISAGGENKSASANIG
jgi:hypothetical protein